MRTGIDFPCPLALGTGLSPSALTRLVAALEEHLGARLLRRTTRSVTVTDEGERYLLQARRILADLAEADASLQAVRAVPAGRLVVAAPLAFGRFHVGPLFSAYLSRYPDVQGELRLGDRNVNLIEDGIDIAVRIGELGDFHAEGAPHRRDPPRPRGGAGLSGATRHARVAG